MKALPILLALLFAAPALTFAQSSESKKSAREYRKRTTTSRSTRDTSDVSAILKDSSNAETGPILNDNGSVNSTGTIDGRSSTGRPDADTTGSYSVKKRKSTIKAVPGGSRKQQRP
ncbi:hypothetical protein DYBT9623_01341 [Dyadobacter sp. CECT 9623]|uniref:Uncharacterized protein n=1 Tax=Dyadobacter linearis TaxID=2823330 RepID=A0ABN7R8V2_9BACT|nr:hypothetical protein [Dyadobacter sp. CECT 9623]CAG5068609.1 hypothetical protein DYBT9623_01341 [Dyadobacter sp. CECT 9623]